MRPAKYLAKKCILINGIYSFYSLLRSNTSTHTLNITGILFSEFTFALMHFWYIILMLYVRMLELWLSAKTKNFCFLLFLIFFFCKKWGSKTKNKEKVQNSLNKQIKISYLNMFPFELIATWSVVCNLAKKDDFKI